MAIGSLLMGFVLWNSPGEWMPYAYTVEVRQFTTCSTGIEDGNLRTQTSFVEGTPLIYACGDLVNLTPKRKINMSVVWFEGDAVRSLALRDEKFF